MLLNSYYLLPDSLFYKSYNIKSDFLVDPMVSEL